MLPKGVQSGVDIVYACVSVTTPKVKIDCIHMVMLEHYYVFLSLVIARLMSTEAQ